MPTSAEIRQQFLDFFAERGHAIVPSSPLPAYDDPTLLFVNSGMAQFKDIFLGGSAPENLRVADAQKCLRVSGKHNDLEEVGRDTYHHTFFEMLGFWSFGDYFKKEAIAWVWELLTEVWGLPKDRIYATVFEGSERDGVERDEEAAQYWREVTDIDPSHIQYWGKDNFWEMGDTGPCGPSSEIHIDMTPDGSGASLVNQDHPLVIELGNIVFIQFNRDRTGTLSPLAVKHVDFGGGFERMVAVLQGKTSNYDTDLFTTIFDELQRVSGAAAYAGTDSSADVAYRVIADHLRCLCFAIADGVIPSNEGGGYVLRRVLRRAARHGLQDLGLSEPFLCRLVPTLVGLMADAYPELRASADRMVKVLEGEERSFARTLGRGIELFDHAAKAAVEAGSDQVSAQDAFKLHDTYGFPLDLTAVMASERNMTVDTEGFQALMEQARELARSAGGPAAASGSLVDVAQLHQPVPTEFTGYSTASDNIECEPLLCVLVEGTRYERSDSANAGDAVAIAFSKTCFYAEAGGQVGDTGTITTSGGAVITVTDTQKAGGAYFHIGKVESGVVDATQSAIFDLVVDADRRAKIMANHTGTHMMNLGLRHVLGDKVEQRGSLVDDTKLRFDLSHDAPVSTGELEAVQDEVNASIGEAAQVFAEVVDLNEATKIRNLRAVFGEKYPQRVRVVSVGVPVSELMDRPDDPAWDNVSIEFCGGTHLASTDAASAFVFVAEEAVAKGVRRVTALTGDAAIASLEAGRRLVTAYESAAAGSPDAGTVASLMSALDDDTLPAVVRSSVRMKVAELQKVVKEKSKESGQAAAAVLASEIEALQPGPSGAIVAQVSSAEPTVLRAAVEQASTDAPMLIASVSGDSAALVARVGKSTTGLSAGDWVRHAATAVGGKGGGRPDIAQAGLRDISRLPDALEAARAFVEASGQ